MQLKWTEAADNDLLSIESYISTDNNSDVAIDVVMNIIDTTFMVLSEYPRAGRQGRVKQTRELIIDGLPFVVVYREKFAERCLEILRVLHTSQQWPSLQ